MSMDCSGNPNTNIPTSQQQNSNRKDQIVHVGDYVLRPAGFWTKQVHNFLDHLHKEGFSSVPKPFGFDKSGREIVSFIKGEVSDYPLSNNAASFKALTSSAKLLRKYHDASQSFLNKVLYDDKCWQLPPRYPKEVICHGDFAPYNVVLKSKQAIGIIDFDVCHPGPRKWDIAYALYRWAPITNPNNQDGFGSLNEQAGRARLFCESYGLSKDDRSDITNLIIQRLEALVDFMITQASKDNEIYKANIQDNHHLLYLEDIEYIKLNKLCIEDILTQKETAL